ncbi:MAG: phosphoribosylformylglycinamidine synthase subunit PurS, partial [Dehalococcoidia bacterium]
MSKDSRAPKDPKDTKDAKERLYQARVFISLKPTVNDPEGKTIAGALASLGFGGVDGVRSGKYFQLS